MCPFPSVHMAKYPWNPRLPPAQACCFPLESSTWGRGVHQNTQTELCLGSGKAPCPRHCPPLPPPNTISIHLIGRQAEGSGKGWLSLRKDHLSMWEQRGERRRPASTGDGHGHL